MKLEVMPLNSNGKVDRRALPAPASQAAAARTVEPPRTETEREIALIWQEALNRKDIGVTDNFFDSGGHSLKVAKVVSLIEKKLGIAIPLASVFKHATIRELAAYVLDKARFGIDVADEPMVCLSRGSARTIFAFPPGTGDAAGFIQVADALKPSTFYGFNFIEAETRIGDYADLVMRVDVEGPYFLFGYSSGGNLAYHVAHELERRGRSVSDIVMVDSGRKLERFPFDPVEVRAIADEFLSHESNAPYLNTVLLKEKAYRRVESSYAYFENAVDHHRIAANIHLITSENSVDVHHDSSGKLIASKPGWADVTSGTFHKHRGVGDHNHMLYQPYLEGNVRLIRRILGHESI
jgi:thioesterase domain-containing protein/acyl carrier protein